MRTFVIGDVQGCYDELRRLLDKISFTPAEDQLWFVGDLVNRGPQSLETLKFVRGLGDAVRCVLGNHDLHLLALAARPDPPASDTGLAPVLTSPERDVLLNWLTQLPLAHYDAELKTLMVHAGVAPTWSVEQTLAYASEVETVLRSADRADFLSAMYGHQPNKWSADLIGMDRMRFITNCLTRIRFCSRDGALDFGEKLAPGSQPPDLIPWFDIPQRAAANSRIVFGHWSTLGLLQRKNILATDTGCVWGGQLTAVRLDQDAPPLQVDSLQPGRSG